MKRFWVIGLVSLLALGVIGFSIARVGFSSAQPYSSPSQLGMPVMGRGYSNGMPMMGTMGRGWKANWNMPMMGAGGCPMMGGITDARWYSTTAPLTKEQVTNIVQNYIQSTGNSNLKVGKVIETDTDFEVEIVTKDGSLVDKIRVDKRTGWMQSIY